MVENLLAILPEIALLVLAAVLMIVDLSVDDDKKGSLNWISLFGFAAVFVVVLILGSEQEASSVWGGMLRQDWMAYTFRLVFTAGAALTVIFARGWESIAKRGEFYALLAISTLGMTLMVCSWRCCDAFLGN